MQAGLRQRDRARAVVATQVGADPRLTEVASDGTVSAQEFAVPDGHVLVVTDLDWRISDSPSSFAATRVLMFNIYLGAYGVGANVFGAGGIIGSDLAVAGTSVGSASMTTGFRVGPGVSVCPRATAVDSSGGTYHVVQWLNLRGYLIKSK